MKFRNQPLYRGEIFLAVTIPSTEHRDVVPCAATLNADGSHRLQFNILYTVGDIDFAREHGEHIIREHPEWTAGLYRANTGAFLGEVRAR